MHDTTQSGRPSVFEKFGGIRPMAAKVGRPPSTIKSWHKKQAIPEWHRDRVLRAAAEHGIELSPDELENMSEYPTRSSTERAA